MAADVPPHEFCGAELAALRSLTGLKRLALHLGGRPPVESSAQLCAAVGSLRQLRMADLGPVVLDVACLGALAGSSCLTSLIADNLLAPPQRSGHTLTLPGQLRRLQLHSPPSVSALAALHPPPPSLEAVCLTTCAHPPLSRFCLQAGGVNAEGHDMDASVPLLMADAMALLAGRLGHVNKRLNEEEQQPRVEVVVLASWGGNVGHGDGMLRGPAGAGHAAWLPQLGLLRCEALRFQGLALATGDLQALAAASPMLQVRRWWRAVCVRACMCVCVRARARERESVTVSATAVNLCACASGEARGRSLFIVHRMPATGHTTPRAAARLSTSTSRAGPDPGLVRLPAWRAAGARKPPLPGAPAPVLLRCRAPVGLRMGSAPGAVRALAQPDPGDHQGRGGL